MTSPLPDAVCVLATLVSSPQGRRRLSAALGHLSQAAMHEPGTLLFLVHEEVDSPGTFVVFERYADQAASDAHRSSAAMACFREALRELGIRPALHFLLPMDSSPAPARS